MNCDDDQWYQTIKELTMKLRRLEMMSSGMVDQLDEVEMLSSTQFLFQEELNNLNSSRNDFKLIENFIGDLEIHAYIKDLEKTLELVRK